MKSNSDKLLLHAKTKKQLQDFSRHPSNAVLVTALVGSGKTALAQALAADLLAIPAEKLSDYPYYMFITGPEDKQEIPIESIRKLISSLNLRVPSDDKQAIKRVIIIEGAENMSTEAQNALLKSLEEPPKDTLIILTAQSANDILPTVASRTQKIQITAPTLADSLKFYGQAYEPKDIESAWQLSQGGAGLMQALLADQEHPLKQAVDDAKNLLRAGVFERLVSLDKLAANKKDFAVFLDGLSRVLAALHHAAVQKRAAAQSKKLLGSRRLVTTAAESLAKNTSTRLICLQLALNLPL